MNWDGLITVPGVRVVVPTWQFGGRIPAEVLLVGIVERAVVLCVSSEKNFL